MGVHFGLSIISGPLSFFSFQVFFPFQGDYFKFVFFIFYFADIIRIERYKIQIIENFQSKTLHSPDPLFKMCTFFKMCTLFKMLTTPLTPTTSLTPRSQETTFDLQSRVAL